MTKLVIYEGDCLDVLARLPNKSVDCIVTSPPFNTNAKYSTYQDNLPDKQYLNFLYKVTQQLARVIKTNGSFFINFPSNHPELTFRYITMIESLFKIQNVLHWIKSISINRRTYGHFRPLTSKRFVNSCHEFIFHLTKTANVALNRLAVGVPYQDKSNLARFNHAKDLRCRGNCWYIPYPTQNKKLDHPATFPIRLARMCIKLHGVKRAVVLDPFMGSGTTLLAARREKVKLAIGIDLDKSYVQTTQQRLQAAGASKVTVKSVAPISKRRK